MTKALAARFTQFVPAKEKSPYLWPGESLFLWQARPGLRVYVVVSPDLKAQQDAFTVSLAWSKLDRFPHLSMRPLPYGPSADGAEFARDEFEVALYDLCQPPRQWWSVFDQTLEPLAVFETYIQNAIRPVSREEARATVGPLVDDAVTQLERFGMPYITAFLDHTETRG